MNSEFSHQRIRFRVFLVGAICAAISFASAALAVSTSHWTQNSEPDFKTGTLHNVVATNLGDVKLSRAVKTLLEEDPTVSMVTALAQGKSGTIYAGTAPRGVILQINGDTVTPLLTVDDAVSITALIADGDGLIIGTSGATGRVLRIDKPGDKPHEIFSAKEVQYIWSLVKLPDGMIYAATGPNGQLFSISPDGKTDEIYKSDENNLTALTSDGKDLLYVGSDPNGLVVRVNRKSKESFVMYNAEESEITALALDDSGNLYAATGEPPSGPPQPAENQPSAPSGRPQTPSETPLPSQPPSTPKPPPPAPPNPGQPPPIPQKPSSTDFLRPHGRSTMPIVLVADMDDGSSPDQPAPPTVPGLPDQPDNGSGEDANAKAQEAEKAPEGGDKEAAKPQGNAIYRIDKDGFVTEIFRENVVIYSMLQTHGVLLVGTGDDGEIYQVDPAAQETAVIAKTEAKQVTSLLAGADGRVILGLSNAGSLAAMTDGYADSGDFTSPVLDASQVSRFGVIQMHGSLPTGTALTVSTRAGNVKDADSEGWSAWTDPANASEFLPVRSSPARFLQYRIFFKTTDPAQTPIINNVDVAYQMPHLAPVVRSIKLQDEALANPPPPPPSGKSDSPKSAGTGTQTITWDASSPDDDPLVYSLYFRAAQSGPWILLKDKLTDATFNWDTRSVSDGRYQVMVSASDAAANPPGDGKTASRVSDVLVVDNTPPVIGDLKTSVAGNSVKIDLRVVDQTSTVASMDYSVDSNDVWQTVLPVDKIFDQPEETVSISLDGLAAGPHQITLRAADSVGNVAYQTVMVTVGAAAK